MHDAPSSAAGDLDMREFVRLLRRHLPLIAGVTLFGGIAGGVAALLTPKEYVATARLFVRTTPDPPATSELLNRYRGIPNDPAVAQTVLADTG
ncbi:MAG TPA: Wzz/FepE/Etk N-terminal domain-containing protein, partial [Vicinamibacterales bacterium]|nr:Wzz/FepE/Etk N-terminal domain-containing protein [Vicinamibacterales bacterium]